MLTINVATSFEAPRLEVKQGLAQFDNNNFTAVVVAYLGVCADLSIESSSRLRKIYFRARNDTSGQLNMTNNTMLGVVDELTVLAIAGADIKVRGTLSQ
jgi:hypothetical protein